MNKRRGIKIPGMKSATSYSRTVDFLNPEFIYIPTSVKGTDFDVFVEVGDKVTMGQTIARRPKEKGLPITKHSSVSGEVIGFEKKLHRTGLPYNVIKIKNDFKDTYSDDISPVEDIDLLDNVKLAEIISKGGVVGLGGSGFPTAIKFLNTDNIDTIVLNGAECEPYITSDYRIMFERPEKVIDGLYIMMRAAKADHGVIGIKEGKKDVYDVLVEVASKYDNIDIIEVPDYYPAGWEKEIVFQTLGRTYDRLPLECGVIVNNVSTAASVSTVVREGKPVIERIVTLTGEAMSKPMNVKVRIGTLASELFEKMGGINEDIDEVTFITGGPMMGKAQRNIDVVITRGVGSLLALPSLKKYELDKSKSFFKQVKELLKSNKYEGAHYLKDEQVCVRCGRCVANCPAHIKPLFLSKFSKRKDFDKLEELDIAKCIECGTCSYVCPSHIELTEAIGKGKRFYLSRKKK